jgi:hypothetical protein
MHIYNGERMKENFKRKILFRCIIEMMGTPKEHLDKTLRNYIKALKKREELEFIKSNYGEPKKEEDEELYSSFVELEIWTTGIYEFMSFCLEALPASVEIIEPAELRINNSVFSNMSNDIISRLHDVSMHLKNTVAKNDLLEKNITVITTNLIGIALKDKPRTLEELSKLSGIEIKKLHPFLEQQVKKGIFTKTDEKYVLKR